MEIAEILKWLNDNRDVIKLSTVEREIGCPSTTLHKALQETMSFPVKWEDPLRKWLKKFIKPIAKV